MGTPCVSCVMCGVPVLQRGPCLGTRATPTCIWAGVRQAAVPRADRLAHTRSCVRACSVPACPGPTWGGTGPADGVQCAVTSSPFGCLEGPGPAACTQSPPFKGPSSGEDGFSSVTTGQRVTEGTFKCFPSRATVRKCTTGQDTCVLWVCTCAVCVQTATDQVSPDVTHGDRSSFVSKTLVSTSQIGLATQ